MTLIILRHFYDLVDATLDKAPGYQGRVIGGMCYVILYDKNEIVDPEADTLELHPKLQKALEDSEKVAQLQQRIAELEAERDAAAGKALLMAAKKLTDLGCSRDYYLAAKEIRALASTLTKEGNHD